MLARDYGSVGNKASFIGAWGTKDFVGKLGSVGRDHDGALAISDAVGNVVQVSRFTSCMLHYCCMGAAGSTDAKHAHTHTHEANYFGYPIPSERSSQSNSVSSMYSSSTAVPVDI